MKTRSGAGDDTGARKAAVLPPARPPKPVLPEKHFSVRGEPIRLCEGGDVCPVVAEIGRPEKLARHNRDDLCYRCRSRRADEVTRNLEARRRGVAPRIHAG